ncbi:Mitochondrial import inner membrane translocase subunit tim54 [Schizosaccharomyces pombe]
MLKTIKSYMPGRNMSIFLGFVAGISGAIYYDRRQKNLIIEKYCSQVRHLADQPMAPLELPRKLKVYLHGPPGDGIYVAREEFEEYIRPIFNAAAIEFETVESKGEGNLLEQVARTVYNKRHNISEVSEPEKNLLSVLKPSADPPAIVLLGRHALKEFLYGVRYGFSDDIMKRKLETEKLEANNKEEKEEKEGKDDKDDKEDSNDTKNDKKISKNEVDSSLIEASPLTGQVPPKFLDTIAIFPLPNLLGFSNTPKRLSRFFKRRELADELGAIAVNVALSRDVTKFPKQDGTLLLAEEETDWPKQFFTRSDLENRIWTAPFLQDSDEIRFFENIDIFDSTKAKQDKYE